MKPLARTAFFALLLAGSVVGFTASAIATMCNPGDGSCTVSGGTPPQIAPAFGEAHSALSSGLSSYTKTDLRIGGVLPIEITRVYRSEDRDANNNFNQRDFGLGTSFNYGLYLYSASEIATGTSNWNDLVVVMPDGAQLTCACQAGVMCNSRDNTVLVCGTTQPAGIWANSILQWRYSIPGWSLTRKDATVYAFGEGAPLHSITDRYGNSITITRSSPSGLTGTLVKVASSSGRSVTFSAPVGLILGAQDNSGRSVGYSYNSSNALTDVFYNTSPQGHTQYIYASDDGDMAQIIQDVNGPSSQNHTYIRYDSAHRVSTLSPNFDIARNSRGTYTYTFVQQPNDCPGASSTLENKVELPDTTIEWFCFNSAGYLTSVTRAPADFKEIAVYTRDPATNRVTEVLEEDSNQNVLRTASYTYSPNLDATNGDVTQIITSPAPGQTLLSTSATTTYNHLAVTLANNNAFDELTSVADPLNHTTTYGYDPAGTGNLISVTDPTGLRKWQYTYWPNGELETATDPLNSPPTQYAYYSPSGDLRSVTSPLNHVTNYYTDGLGRIVEVASPAGGVTQYGYNPVDVYDNVTSTTDPNGNVTNATYDALGEIASVTDPRGNMTTYKRPATLDELTVCDPRNECTVTNYDASGKKTAQTDRRSAVTQISYDNLRRVTKAVYNSNGVSGIPTRELDFKGYDSLDRVGSIVDNKGGGSPPGNTITYNAYDGVDNVLTETTTYTGYSAAITYGYDVAGRMITRAEKINGGGYNFEAINYDPDDEVTNISNNSTPYSFAELCYDLDGNRKTLTTTVSSTTGCTVPPSPCGSSGVCTGYTYDAASRLTAQNFTAAGSSLGNLAYGYDLDDRVTSASGTLASIILPEIGTVNSASYTSTNQVSNWNGTATSYDEASNLKSDPAYSYGLTWDERNLLSTVSNGAIGTFTIQYDAKARRENDTGTIWGTNYYLDDAGTVVDITGSRSPGNYMTLPGSGEVVAYTPTGGATQVPLQDYLGSTIGLVGSSNTLQTQWTYEPFGGAVQSGTSSNYPFLFSGRQLDPTGYYGNFNPSLAHSISGGAVPYTGADAPDFGAMGGRVPHSTDRMTRAASREEAAHAVRNQQFVGGDGNTGPFCGTDECGPSAGTPQNAAGSVPPAVVNFILDAPTDGFGSALLTGLEDLFGGGGGNNAMIHPRPKELYTLEISGGLAATQATTYRLALVSDGLQGPDAPDFASSTWVESTGFSISVISAVVGYDSRSGLFVNGLLGASLGAGPYVQWTRVSAVGAPIGTLDVGYGKNIGVGFGLSQGLNGGTFLSSVSLNYGRSEGLPFGFETPSILGER